MRASRGEIKISDILTMNGMIFQEEYSFPELTAISGTPLRFDFAVFDDDEELMFLIEYQGKQHYEVNDKFGGHAGLRKQQYNDMQKREYCEKHKIVLLIIPYIHEHKINYDYIMNLYYYLEDKMFSAE